MISDPVTTTLELFFHSNGERLISNTINTGSSILFRHSEKNTIDHEIEIIKKQKAFLEDSIQAICKKHVFWRFLLLFRKLPAKSFDTIKRLLPNKQSSQSVNLILDDSIFFGTNAILKFSNKTILSNCNDRYNFQPSVNEMEDAIRLMTFCILHRYIMFYNNTISHVYMQNGPSFVQLLEIFNQRQRSIEKSLSANHSPNGSILLAAFAGHIPESVKIIKYENKDRESITLQLKNFYPFPIQQEEEFLKFSILDTPEFHNLTGVYFGEWWKIWISLNSVAKSNLVLFWSDKQIQNTKILELRAAAERVDDFGETGIGCGITSTIIKACHDLLIAQYGDKAPTLNACETVVDFLTCSTLEGNPVFIEQPFLFYKVSQDRIFWDYLRHGNVLQAVTRKLLNSPAKEKAGLINHAATTFENQIKVKIEKLIRGVNNIKLNAKIVPEAGGPPAWEIDVGFIYHDVLFLVEAKNWFKPEKYFEADDVTLSSRIVRVEGVLRKQDENLIKYKSNVARYWGANLRGAICIVCTQSVEFTASMEDTWWLKKGKIPRICLVDELIKFLRPENVSVVERHPNFIRFD